MRIRIQISTATVKAVHPRLQQAYQHDDVRVDLLSAPLTILLIYCHIKSFRRVSPRNEAMAGRRKEERRADSASHGC